MPSPNAIEASRQFRESLARDHAASVERMGRIYARIFITLSDQVQALADEIALMDNPTRGKVTRLARMQAILRQVREQVARFGATVEGEIVLVQDAAIQQGIDDALQIMRLSLPPLTPEAEAAILANFTTLPADAVEAAAGLLGKDSPLRARLQAAYGDFVADQVELHIVDGIAVGQNPRRIARLLNRNLQNSLGVGLKSAITTVRTAQIKSYQAANHMQYAVNERIVPTWEWNATLDERTCLSCINMHGTVHPVTETLNDHHNGRCAPLPKTISYRDLGINLPDPVEDTQRGEDWFNEQSAATQREIMGPGKYDAWKQGLFEFEDLSQPYQDDVYGELLREASLKDLI